MKHLDAQKDGRHVPGYDASAVNINLLKKDCGEERWKLAYFLRNWFKF